jgi:hypothetical protein
MMVHAGSDIFANTNKQVVHNIPSVQAKSSTEDFHGNSGRTRENLITEHDYGQKSPELLEHLQARVLTSENSMRP